MPFGCVIPRPARITVRIGAPLSFEAQTNTREGWNEVVRACEGAVRGLAGDTARGG
jgi:hypothetical protein